MLSYFICLPNLLECNQSEIKSHAGFKNVLRATVDSVSVCGTIICCENFKDSMIIYTSHSILSLGRIIMQSEITQRNEEERSPRMYRWHHLLEVGILKGKRNQFGGCHEFL